MNSSFENRLDALIQDYVERVRRGEQPDVDEYCGKHPELAADIRELFPTLGVMEQARPDAVGRPPKSGPAAIVLNDRTRDVLGDYRLLRELGRGGMGVVFEADQESLGRHVALKILAPHALLEPRFVLRFQREARAAAKLHHTNIVPVFGVGVQDGIHYYVMQLISGMGLHSVLTELRRLRGPTRLRTATNRENLAAGAKRPAEGAPVGVVTEAQTTVDARQPMADQIHDSSAVLIAESLCSGLMSSRSPAAAPPSTSSSGSQPQVGNTSRETGSSTTNLSQTGFEYWMSVARIGMQVADAMEYADRQGVLHRDIKPSNLLLDLQGDVWVTDFGLAKSVEAVDLTQSGDIVGTLRYLAPERLRGKCDLRSDIYSLGATLYELVTLEPAFPSSDRAKLVQQISHEQPLRPRAIDPTIPRDLETILLKAIAFEPADRYQSPAELAADLRRFVEDKPILARRATWREQAWRWARRNPQLAAVTSLAALLLVTTVIVLAVSNTRIRREIQEKSLALSAKEAALRAEKVALFVAEESAELARQRLYASETNLAQSAINQGELARALDLLEHHRPAAGTRDRRGFEWHFLWQSLHQNLHRSIHPAVGEITGLAFSPDGRTLAIGLDWAESGGLSLWNVETGTQLQQLGGPQTAPHGVKFSSDGKRLCAGIRQNAVVIWDVASGTELQRWPTTSPVKSADWSADGRWIVAGTDDGLIQLWNLDARERQVTLPKIDSIVEATFFSADSRRLYVSQGATQENLVTQVYDLSVWPLDPPQENPGWRAKSASPQRDGVVGAFWGTIEVRDANHQPRWRRTVSPGTLADVRFAADGKRVGRIGFDDRLVEIWSLDVEQPLQRVPHPASPVVLAFDPKGQFYATGDIAGEVRIWRDTSLPRQSTWTRTPPYGALCVASTSQEILLGAADVPVEFRDQRTLAPHSSPPAKHVFDCSADGQVLVSFVPGDPAYAYNWFAQVGQPPQTVEVWDRAGSAPRFTLRLPDKEPLAYLSRAVSKSGRLLVTRAWDGPIRVWNIAGSKPEQVAELEERTCLSLSLSPDERIVAASCKYGRVALWDITTRTPLPDPFTFESNTSWAAVTTFSQDSRRLAAGDGAGTVRVWDLEPRRLLATLKGHLGGIQSLAFFPDHRTLAVAGTGPVRLWDVETGQERLTIPVTNYKTMQLGITADGLTLFARGDDGLIHRWSGTE